MDIQKIFAEMGRMHLENMQVRDLLAQAEAQVAALKLALKEKEGASESAT